MAAAGDLTCRHFQNKIDGSIGLFTPPYSCRPGPPQPVCGRILALVNPGGRAFDVRPVVADAGVPGRTCTTAVATAAAWTDSWTTNGYTRPVGAFSIS